MDGKGRWVDNVIIERASRSVKYEEVYLNAYESIVEARKALNAYFEYYNCEPRHPSLDRKHLMKFTGVTHPNKGQPHEQAACT